MQAGEFEEDAFFRAVAESGCRVLLIGRMALVALGIPVLTADFDLWCDIDSIEQLNAALEPLGLYPNHPPDEARRRGRYVLENDAHVDVFIARSRADSVGNVLRFDDAWQRRQTVSYAQVSVALPSLDDLVSTKRWAMRPKDLHDIQLIEALRRTKQ